MEVMEPIEPRESTEPGGSEESSNALDISESPEPKKQRKPRRQKAVIDRIEEGKWAVLLIGRKEIEKVIPVEQLPEGAKAGSWLKVRLVENNVQDVITDTTRAPKQATREGIKGASVEDIVVDESATKEAETRVASKMDRLRSRGSSFKSISAPAVGHEDSQAAETEEKDSSST